MSKKDFVNTPDIKIKGALCGFAPGRYMTHCRKCDQHVMGLDKRASRCLPCAIDDAIDLIQAQQDQIRELSTFKTSVLNGVEAISTALSAIVSK